MRYLLPCPCGERVSAGAAQAGGTVRCACGRTLDVPTMRGLRDLETDADAAQDEAAPGWDLRKGLMLLGGIIAVAAAAPAIYFLATYPERPRIDEAKQIAADRAYIDRMPVSQTWDLWQIGIREHGIKHVVTEDELQYQKQAAQVNQRLAIVFTAAAIGVLIAIGGAFVRPAPRGEGE